MRTRQVGLRLTEEEFAKLEGIERQTNRKRHDVLRLLLREAVLTGVRDVILERRMASGECAA